jgi:hypothetical protein
MYDQVLYGTLLYVTDIKVPKPTQVTVHSEVYRNFMELLVPKVTYLAVLALLWILF